jgi:glycosyltransferase involved in cell wall biosynthesis
MTGSAEPRTGGLPVVALTRHRDTEPPLSSVHAVFAAIQEAAESAFEVRPLPSYHQALPPAAARALWLDLLSSCQVVVTDTPGRVARLREEHGLAVRILYLPLGGFPRGASAFRRALPLFRAGDVIAFSSTADRQVFERLTDACRADRTVVPFSVDTSRFAPDAAGRRRIRALFGWSDEDCVFVYAGRITAEKNLLATLALFDAVLARHPRAHLLVVGAAEDTPFVEFGTGPFDMERVLAQMLDSSRRLRRSVHRLPWLPRSELPALLSACDVFLNLSLNHDENFGLGQVEAMSCGLPVICTEWGGLKDTAVNELTALTVPTFVCDRGIQLDLWRAFQHCQALLSPDRRLRLGRAGRQRALAQYSAERFRRTWIELLSGRAAEREKGDRDNRLSRLGLQFEAAFGQRRPPLFDQRTHSLYAGLIGPYATGEAAPDAPRRAVVYLTTVSFDLTDGAVEVLDPLWPGSFRIDPLEHRLVAALERALLDGDVAFLPLEELARVGRMSEEQLRPRLRRLQDLGIVGCSGMDSQETCSHEGEPDAAVR